MIAQLGPHTVYLTLSLVMQAYANVQSPYSVAVQTMPLKYLVGVPYQVDVY